MSAIAGIWRRDGKPDARESVARMLAAQSIYGPHDSAQWSDGAVGLGRRLFRTLPEDIHDRGPLVGGDGTLRLVADVRLDNRDWLARQLGMTAERASVLCDAQIVLSAFERWGDAAVEQLSGDFALALWDTSRRRLLLARDFLGQRPLHYHHAATFVAFASMPKGLHALPDIPRAPDQERAAEFVALVPETGPRSFFEGIARVEPGQMVVVTDHGMSARRYWEPSRSRLRLSQPDDYVEGLRHHFDAAVRAQLRGADKEVGAHLSAGMDSGAVAATAARILAATGGRVISFTAVPRSDYAGLIPNGYIADEGPLAASTAALHANMEHVRISTAGQSPVDTLDRDSSLFERPVLNRCNNVWWEAINDEARTRQLTVVLKGQMGNMTSSYDGASLFPELLLAGRWGRLFMEGRAAIRSGHLRRGGAAARTLVPLLPASLRRRWKRMTLGSDRDVTRYSAINPERLTAFALAERARWRDMDASYRPGDSLAMRLRVLRYVDHGNYNKGTLARCGIDQRDPTANKQLAEFCLSVPPDQFFFNGVPRSLARRAFSDRMSRAALDERRKGLQAIDWHEGLTAARVDMAEEIERLAACAPASAVLDVPRLRALVERWPSGGWHEESIDRSYRRALLRGVSVGHFLRTASGG